LILATFPLAYAVKDWNPFKNNQSLRYKLFIPLFIVCVAEIYPVYVKSINSIQEIHLPMKIIFALSIIFLICVTFFYKREGKLFSEEIFILRRKPLIALSVFQAILFFAGSYFTMPPINYEQHKPAVEFLLNENRAEDITLWTGFNTGGYFEFNGIKCYIDARPEIFALSNNHQKDIIKEYLELLRGDLDYREFFSRYNFTHIFITTADKIPYLMLSNDPNYKMVFEYDFQQWGKKFHGKIFRSVKNYD
jgi:hypothetical protein